MTKKSSGFFIMILIAKPIILIMDILICIDISMLLYYNIIKQKIRRN